MVLHYCTFDAQNARGCSGLNGRGEWKDCGLIIGIFMFPIALKEDLVESVEVNG